MPRAFTRLAFSPAVKTAQARYGAREHGALLEQKDPPRNRLEARNRRVGHVYFLDKGLASVVANGGESAVEVGMIGSEGMTGLSVVLDGDTKNRAVHETFMQIAGNGQRMPANNLREAIEASVSLHRVLLRYANTFMIQTTQTALANGRGKRSRSDWHAGS